MQAIAKTNAKRIVLVLMHGGGVATPEEASEDRIGAILDAFYGGVYGPQAIADVVGVTCCFVFPIGWATTPIFRRP